MKTEGDLQILIVDDHALFRRGIRSILEGYSDIQIVGEASNGIEAIMLMEQLHPSVVLMDINMPRMSGIEATALIRSGYPDTIIIGLSVNASPENQASMKRAGAFRLIPKEEAGELLYDVIHHAAKSH
jgi:DNA-binding NarL/FixJ family response regulator